MIKLEYNELKNILTETALLVYSETDPLTIYEYTDNGKKRYAVIGAWEENNLNRHDLNRSLACFWDEGRPWLNRYQAVKHKGYGDITVKVEGGYRNMSARAYSVWKLQK